MSVLSVHFTVTITFQIVGGKALNFLATVIKEVGNYQLKVGINDHENTHMIYNSMLNIDKKDFVPREKLLREFFPNADVFVLVPPKVEGFGFSVLEAISFGIPVVVSNVCALPELVENGKTGFVVKPGSVNDLVEKLEILIKDQTLREKMGDAARKRFLEKFSIEKSNSGLLKIYNNALKSS